MPSPQAAGGLLLQGPSDLDRAEYRTDDFRMHGFKVLECAKTDIVHDWTECPFVHPSEKARRRVYREPLRVPVHQCRNLKYGNAIGCRRDPRTVQYSGVACPDFRKGTCKRGDLCPYAHGVFECWLHPSR